MIHRLEGASSLLEAEAGPSQTVGAWLSTTSRAATRPAWLVVSAHHARVTNTHRRRGSVLETVPCEWLVGSARVGFCHFRSAICREFSFAGVAPWWWLGRPYIKPIYGGLVFRDTKQLFRPFPWSPYRDSAESAYSPLRWTYQTTPGPHRIRIPPVRAWLRPFPVVPGHGERPGRHKTSAARDARKRDEPCSMVVHWVFNTAVRALPALAHHRQCLQQRMTLP